LLRTWEQGASMILGFFLQILLQCCKSFNEQLQMLSSLAAYDCWLLFGDLLWWMLICCILMLFYCICVFKCF
jgi:hypothetical protein